MALFGRRRTADVATTRDPVRELVTSSSYVMERVLRENAGTVRRLEGLVEATTTQATQAIAASRRGGDRLTVPSGDDMIENRLKSTYMAGDSANHARKVSLYQAYLGEAWVSACIEAIAARLISGGWILSPEDKKRPNLKTKAPLEEYLDWCNPDEEFNEVIHSMATDLLWAGECYLEVTWRRSRALHRTVPYELYTVDPISMDYVLAPNLKAISGYVQQTDSYAPLRLPLDSIIRIWLPDPRNRFKALSPLEKVLNAVTQDTYIQLSETKFFQQGNRSDLAILLRAGDEKLAARMNKWIQEKMLGVKNAHKPLVLFGDQADLEVMQLNDKSQLDVIPRRKLLRDEILAVYKVPPHLISALEGTGQGGQAVGETMEAQFLHTAVDPLRQRMMAQLSFQIGTQGFGITDWTIDTTYADMRDDSEIVEIATKRIFAGLSTINAERAKQKDDPIPGGDVAFLYQGGKLILVESLLHQPVAPGDPEVGPAPPAPAGPGGKKPGGGGGKGPGGKKQATAASTGPNTADKKSSTVPTDKDRYQRPVKEGLTEGPPYRYGCLLVDLPPGAAAIVNALKQAIDPADLDPSEAAERPHITIRYGITQTERPEVAGVLGLIGAQTPPFPIRLAAIRSFQNEGQDVLYAAIEGPILQNLHGMATHFLPGVPGTHPGYVPHATIAYLKPGRAAAYVGTVPEQLGPHTVKTLVLTNQAGTRLAYDLEGKHYVSEG